MGSRAVSKRVLGQLEVLGDHNIPADLGNTFDPRHAVQ